MAQAPQPQFLYRAQAFMVLGPELFLSCFGSATLVFLISSTLFEADYGSGIQGDAISLVIRLGVRESPIQLDHEPIPVGFVHSSTQQYSTYFSYLKRRQTAGRKQSVLPRRAFFGFPLRKPYHPFFIIRYGCCNFWRKCTLLLIIS